MTLIISFYLIKNQDEGHPFGMNTFFPGTGQAIEAQLQIIFGEFVPSSIAVQPLAGMLLVDVFVGTPHSVFLSSVDLLALKFQEKDAVFASKGKPLFYISNPASG